jgi:TIR domain
MAYDVFLSYSSKDKYAADAACAVLERNGIRVWMAPRDILPGLGWGTSVIEAINHARVMVLVLSGNANISPQIEREVERAINKGLQVIPFRIEDVEPSEALQYFISAAHCLDAFTKPLEQHLDRLAEVVRRVIDVRYGKAGAPAEAEAARRTENEPGGREQEQAAKLVAEDGEQRKAEWALREKQAAERTERERRGSAAPQSEKWFVAETRPVGKVVAGFVVLALLGISLALVSLRPSPLSVSAVGTEPANEKSGAEPGAVDLLVRDAFKKGNEAYTAKDYAQAMSWYRKAADQGNASAQKNMQRMAPGSPRPSTSTLR